MSTRTRMLSRMQKAKEESSVLRENTPAVPDSTHMEVSFQKLDNHESDNRVTMHIAPEAILKNWNPREIPLSLEEMRSIQWPTLDTDGEELDKSLSETIDQILANADSFGGKLQGWNKEEMLSFYHEIHLLARSIRDNGQYQDVVVYRSDADFTKYILLAGERRVVSFVYGGVSDANMPQVRCLVYTVKPAPLTIALIQDQENTQKEDLRFHELLKSKRAIFEAFTQENPVPSARKGAQLFSYKSHSFASTLIRLFTRADCDEILSLVKSKNLSQKDLASIVAELDSEEGSQQSPSEEAVLSENTSKPAVSKAVEKLSKRGGANKSESIEKRVSSAVKKQEQGDAFQKKAKHYGLTINKKTDLSLIQYMLEFMLNSKKVSKEQKDQIKACLKEANHGQVTELLMGFAEQLEA